MSVSLFLFFSWWVQTTVEIGSLDSNFDAGKIIHEVERQGNSYAVIGFKNLFELDQNKKISKISLKQGRSIVGKSGNTKLYETVFVNVWKSGKSNDPIMYSCRYYDVGKLTVSRVYLEGVAVDAKDLNGNWEGLWSWKSSEKSVLKINEGFISFVNFPIFDSDGTLSVLNSNGKVDHQEPYGADGKNCILVYPDISKYVVPLFIRNGTEKPIVIEHNADTSANRKIEFIKK